VKVLLVHDAENDFVPPTVTDGGKLFDLVVRNVLELAGYSEDVRRATTLPPYAMRVVVSSWHASNDPPRAPC
jgi:hypothetical protein